jgi:plasmid stabilization system protein ParE
VKVQWSSRAIGQVQEIFEFIARDRPGVARDIANGLFDATALLSETPDMGSLWRPEQRSDLRFILFKTYRILYRVDPDQVFVVSVRHTRRDAGAGGATGG